MESVNHWKYWEKNLTANFSEAGGRAKVNDCIISKLINTDNNKTCSYLLWLLLGLLSAIQPKSSSSTDWSWSCVRITMLGNANWCLDIYRNTSTTNLVARFLSRSLILLWLLACSCCCSWISQHFPDIMNKIGTEYSEHNLSDNTMSLSYHRLCHVQTRIRFQDGKYLCKYFNFVWISLEKVSSSVGTWVTCDVSGTPIWPICR